MTEKCKPRWQGKLFIAFVATAILVTIVAFFINRYWSPILAAKVRSTILISTDSLYHADFSDAEFHIVQGKLVIHNLTLKPNMAVYNRKLKAGLAPNNLYTLKVKRIVLKHMHPFKLYHNKVDIGQIVLSAPELQVSYQLNHKTDTTDKNQITAWQRIRSTLKSIHIKQVMLNDVKFTYKDYSGNHLEIAALKEMNLTGNEFLIDSATQFQTSRFYYFKDIEIELNNFTRPTANKLYDYKIKLLKYSTLSQQLQAFKVALVPRSENEFIKRNVRSWFEFDADSLQLDSFNFKNYNKYRQVYGKKLTLRRGNLVINANRPKQGIASGGNKLLTFPNEALRHLQNDFKLDTIELHRLHITYKGIGKKSHKRGMLSFNNTNGYVLNLTNNAAALKKNNMASIKLTTSIMEVGPMQADISFNLTDSARSYAYKGIIGQMELDGFNKATMPFALLKITSGWLDKFSFDIKGNRYASSGNVSMQYHDLKVHLLKMDTVSDIYRHRAIPSLLANALIVKRSNPDYLGAIPRSISVNYVRQPDTPFFKAVWKTLFMGIKASAGFDAATEKEVKQHIAQHIIDKRNRQQKRALRKQRRAARMDKKRHKGF